jgi:Protein of unknown function (DUF2934)
MAVQKERRATPRKPGTRGDAAPVVADTTPAKAAKSAPKAQAREMPAEQEKPEEMRRRIEMAAYLRAKQRGFQPGFELDDWLKAEAEVKNQSQPRR